MHDHENCARCDAIEAELAAMRGALKELEWQPHVGGVQDGAFCLACGAWLDEGHREKCWLVAVTCAMATAVLLSSFGE